MKIRRITSLIVLANKFKIVWDAKINTGNAGINYADKIIWFGVKQIDTSELFSTICHELQELCAIEMYVRHSRDDCNTDYIFVYDHRQHTTMMYMFSGLLQQFII